MATGRGSATERLPEERLDLDEDDRIIEQARERFKRLMDWERESRNRYVEDVKFANGDPDNGWMWPQAIKQSRDASQRPCLTINRVQQYILNVVNENRKNPPSVKIKPTGGDGTFQAAQVWEGLFRNIQYESNAVQTYVTAAESQVEGGVGYWRVSHDYVDDHSFDQSIKIDPIADQFNAGIDCDCKQSDGSDAKWGFVWEDIDKKEFKREYPDIEVPSVDTFALSEAATWITTDKIRIAEYYRLMLKRDTLIYLESEGTAATFFKSDMPAKFQKLYRDAKENNDNLVKEREVKRYTLEWFKIGGTKIIERRTDLKGQYIPIVRICGRSKRIDGKLERKGLTRTLKDAQRMYNYNTSGQVEFGALQTKTPWIVAEKAIEGNEGAWHVANTTNAAYLTYKHMDVNGNPIPEPKRNDPPGTSPAFLEGLKVAAAEMEMAGGQYMPQQPNPQLERTPKAIDERTRMSETATFDFVFNLAGGVTHTARIMLDLAPHVYDTERVVKILDPDGTQKDVQIQPNAEQAMQEQQSGDKAQIIFNPTIGRYGVQGDVGPAYGTQRAEAWNAFENILTQQPDLIPIVGDIAFQAADFPMADKIAERLKRHITHTAPWLIDDKAVGPMVQQLQQELQKTSQMNNELMEKLSEAQLKIKSKDEARDIDTYRAEGERLGTIANTIPDLDRFPKAKRAAVAAALHTIQQMLGFSLEDVKEANKPSLDAQERPEPESEKAKGATNAQQGG